MRRNSLVLLFLTFLGLLVYFNSLNNAFHFDDEHHIYFNPYIRSLRNIPSFFIDPKTVSVSESKEAIGSLYRPLLMVTHAINYAVGGLNPLGYHLVNLGFHVGSAYLLFLIVQAMLTLPLTPSHQGRGIRWSVSSQGGGEEKAPTVYCLLSTVYFIPLSAAIIFVVHPFNSEVVNYITARSSVMSAFFYLLAFYLWVRFRSPLPIPPPSRGRELKGGGRVREGVGFYIASLIAFLLALLTKEIAITLPAMLLLYDLYFIHGNEWGGVIAGTRRVRSNRSVMRLLRDFVPRNDKCAVITRQTKSVETISKTAAPYLPFFLLAVFYLWLRRSFRGTLYTEILGGYENTLNQICVLAKYLQLLLWPFPLSIEHDLKDITTILKWEFLAAFIALILVIGTGIWLVLSPRPLTLSLSPKGRGKSKIASFFIFWYFITLLPLIPVRLHAILQENRGYLAGVGFAVIVGIGIGKMGQRLTKNGLGGFSDETPTSRWLTKDDENANSVTLNLVQSLKRCRNKFGMTFKINGLGAFSDEKSNNTAYSFVWVFLLILISLLIAYSTVTIQQNRVWRDDVTLWTDAVAKNPLSVRAYSNLGRAYLRAGRLDVAEKTLLHALDMNMTFRRIDYIHIRYDLTTLYLQQGKFDLAREHMLEAIRHAPDDPGFYVTLGNIYGVEKRWGEAIAAYKKALEVRPDYTEALARIGIIHVIQEMYHEAIPYLIEASRDKDYPRSSDVQIALKKSLGMVR